MGVEVRMGRFYLYDRGRRGGRPVAAYVGPVPADAAELLLRRAALEREQAGEARRGRAVPLNGIRQTARKVARVRRLGTYLGRGQVRCRDTPGTRRLFGQLREFPLGSADDGPDALELAARRLELLARPR